MSRMGLLLAGMAVFSLVACTANGDSADASPTYHHGGNASADKSSDSKATSSSSTDSDSSDYSIQDLVEMVSVPAVAYSRGTVEYRVDAFAIGKTEVTQGLYRKVMGAISKDDDLGDDFPVFNVADIYVTCSVFILAYLILFYYKEEELSFFQRKGGTDHEQ